MKNTHIFSAIILLFFSFSFLMIGYAAISNELYVKGDLEINPPIKKIYISDVKVYSTSGTESISLEYLYPTNLATTVNAKQQKGSITYQITVHNNTDVTYWYHGILLIEDVESNNFVFQNGGIDIITKDNSVDNSETFNSTDFIPPKTYRTFYATYTFGSLVQGYHTTFLNYHFDIQMDAIYDGFEKVLNDKTGIHGYNYLTKVFNEKYQEDGTTVIANVGEDKEIFDNIFGGDLYIEENGVKKPVTVMISRKNVDDQQTGDSYTNGPTGCEYTLFLSTEDLSNPGEKVIVHAISYTVNENGQIWYQLAELYEGTTNVIDYDTSTPEVEGAVDINNWLANEKIYYISSNFSYKVGFEQGDQYDKIKTIEGLMSAFDQDIFNDIDNKKQMKEAYDLIKANKDEDHEGIEFLRQAFDRASPYFVNHNNGQEFKVKRQYTRAQILPIIKDLQNALDYYKQFK